MQKLLLLLSPILLFFSLTSCSPTTGSSVLKPEDYGAVSGDSLFDCGPAFRRMLADAKAHADEGRAVTIALGDGSYHIYPDSLGRYDLYISNHDYEPQRAVAVYVEGMDGLTIRGTGARLLLHGRQIPVVVSQSKGVTLEGFGIDYPRPALSQIEVLEIDGGEVRAMVLPETKYRIEDNAFILEGEGYEQRLSSTMPFSADRRMKRARADVSFNPAEIVPHEDGTLTLRDWDETPYLNVGDRYVLRSYYRPTPGIVVTDAEAVQIKDVQVHYAEGMALLVQSTRGITLDGFGVDVAEGSDRYFTTQADATHFSGCRGVIVCRNGHYEQMADDAINVHGTYLRVDSIVDAKTVVATFAHHQSFGYSWYEEGDSLRIIDRMTLLPLTDMLSASVETLSPTQLRVTILTDGYDHTVWEGRQVALENFSAMPEVEFVGNTVRNNRARGALFSTPRRVLCADNFFDHTHGSGILLCGDANGWYESGPCHDVTIRGNRFLNALTGMYQFTNGVISIDPELPSLQAGKYYHGRIVVEGNTFETFPSPLIYAESIAEIVWKDNKIVPNEDYEPIFDNTESRLINVGKYSPELEDDTKVRVE